MTPLRHSLSVQKTHVAEPSFTIQSPLYYPNSQNPIYSLFFPRPYEPGYAYPLVVWLHGPGSNERQLRSIMPKVSIQNFVAVAPRGVKIKENDKEEYSWPQTYEQIPQIEEHIFDAIEVAAQKVNISRQRIFLAGFDSGGTMALRVALSHPQYFAGILSICGPFPTYRRLFGNLPMARKLPIFLAIGRYSDRYSDNEVCENLRLLHTAGMSVSLRQYPCGHELINQMLADVNRWIIEQITSPNPELQTINM